jgi:hypothetical protein
MGMETYAGRWATVGLCSFLALTVRCDASDLNLRDLRGYSLVASVDIRESYVTIQSSGRTAKTSTSRYTDIIYVSNNDRVFHRWRYYDDYPDFRKPYFSYDNIRTGARSNVDFIRGIGFVHKHIPSADAVRSTYVQRFTFSIARSGSGFTCASTVNWIKRAGESDFIAYTNSKDYKVVNSFTSTGSSCEIKRGNALSN